MNKAFALIAFAFSLIAFLLALRGEPDCTSIVTAKEYAPAYADTSYVGAQGRRRPVVRELPAEYWLITHREGDALLRKHRVGAREYEMAKIGGVYKAADCAE